MSDSILCKSNWKYLLLISLLLLLFELAVSLSYFFAFFIYWHYYKCPLLIQSHKKILRYFEKTHSCRPIGPGVYPKEKLEKPMICLSDYTPKVLEIEAVLYNWKTADRMKTGYSLNNRHKRAENLPSWHHAPKYHRFLRRPTWIFVSWDSFEKLIPLHFFIVRRILKIQKNID